MAKLLGMAMNYGTLEGSTTLESSSIAGMMRPRFDGDIGLFWITGNQEFGDGSLRSLVGHTGGNPGAFSYLFFDPAWETGAFGVSNGDDDLPEVDEDTVFAWSTTLFDRGDEIKKMYSNTTDDMRSSSGILIAVKMSMLVAAICVASLILLAHGHHRDGAVQSKPHSRIAT